MATIFKVMGDKYSNLNKLIIYFKNNFSLNIESLKFLIKELVSFGINNIEFEIGNDIDINKLYEIIYFIRNNCKVNNIGIITDGFGIYNKIDDLKCYGITDISILLESLKQYKYKKLNHKVNINEVLILIYKCINYKINTKIICTLINNFNIDEVFDFINLTNTLPIEVSFSEITPDPECMEFFNSGYVNVSEVIESVKNLNKLNYVNGKIEYYKLNNSKGIISINSHSKKCLNCNELFLDENGYIKTCINSNKYIDTSLFINKPLIFKESVKTLINDQTI